MIIYIQSLSESSSKLPSSKKLESQLQQALLELNELGAEKCQLQSDYNESLKRNKELGDEVEKLKTSLADVQSRFPKSPPIAPKPCITSRVADCRVPRDRSPETLVVLGFLSFFELVIGLDVIFARISVDKIIHEVIYARDIRFEYMSICA